MGGGVICLSLLPGAPTRSCAQAGNDPIWIVGNNLVDFRANGNDPVEVVPLPICDFPEVPAAYEYQGQTAQYAQNIQCDENGDPLFWIIDGNIYNRQGLLIADNVDGVDGEPCRNCMFKGVNWIGIIPFPGSCTMYYIVSAATIPPPAAAPNSYLRVGLLDLTLPNDWPAYEALPFTVRGRYMTDEDDPFQEFYFWGGSNMDFGSVDEGGIPWSVLEAWYGFGADRDVVRADVAKLDGDLGYLLTWSTTNYFHFMLFNADGVTHVGAQQKAWGDQQWNSYDWRDWSASFRGELETVVVGNTLNVAYSDLHRTWDNRQQLALKYWTFDISSLGTDQPQVEFTHVPEPSPIANPRWYDCGSYPIGLTQFDQDGNTIYEPSLGGIEFAPGGNLLYLVKSTSANDELPPFNLTRSNMWYIDLSENGYTPHAVDLGPLSESIKLVDTQMEYMRWPDGSADAMVVIGKEADPGHHWVGLLTDPAHPQNSVWIPNVAAFDPVALRAHPDQSVPPEMDLVEYRLLNDRIDRNDHWQALQLPACCEALTLAKDESRTIPAGQYDWTVEDNPFHCSGGPITIATELRIAAGAHVNAEDLTFNFGPDARLVIDPGGSFECEGCLLTSACEERWKGINVRGTASQHQGLSGHPAHQGHLVLRESMVENAVIGAKVGAKFVALLGGDQPGGVVQCYNSTFKNCVRGVQFFPYQNFLNTPAQPRRNRSVFSQCVFTADADWPDELDLKAHADLWKVDGIVFYGCTFNNLRTDITESDKLGMGINSLDANYTVKRWCFYVECGAEAVRSSFTGLDHGIHARNSTTTRNFAVEYSDFNNNICGVLTEGVTGAHIVHNEFVLGNRAGVDHTGDVDVDIAPYHRGIYTFRSFAFSVDDNHLVEDANATNSTEGIVVGYSGGHNDMVFRNSCEGIDDAYVGEGICADPDAKPIIGLQFICNENHNNGYNIWNRKIDDPSLQWEWDDHTFRTVQGGLNRPAGNTFDRDLGLPLLSDLHSTANLNHVGYKFWGPGTSMDPLDVDGQNYSKALAQYLPPDNCLFKYPSYNPDDPDGMVLSLEDEKLIYGNTRYQYDQLIDGGSTDEVVQEIVGSWPNEAWALRAYLLGRSPFLSAEALQEMVTRNNLPQAMQVEVMIANPDATRQDGFITWVKVNAPVPFPEYMLAQVMASWDQRTYRTTLEEQMAEHHANMTQAANALLQYFAQDTVGEPTDSLRHAWQRLRTPAARYAEALTCMAQGNYTAANEVVEDIPTEHDLRAPEMVERQRMLDLIAFLHGVQLDGRTETELDSAEVAALEALVADAHDRPAVWAQNLLCYAYERCRAWPTGGDGTDWRALQVQDTRGAEPMDPTMNLAPNPAAGWCVATYDLRAMPVSASVEVLDLTGRTLMRMAVPADRGQALLDTRNLAPGNYTVRLQNNGSVAATAKLLVKE